MLTTQRLTQSELDTFKEQYARDGYFIVRKRRFAGASCRTAQSDGREI